MIDTHRRNIGWLTFVWVLLLGGVIAAADFGSARPLLKLLHAVPLADKLVHFLMFGIVTGLLVVTVARMHLSNPKAAIVAVITVLAGLATAEEVSQLWFRSRTFSVTDLLSNYAGIAAFGWLAATRFVPSTKDE